MSATIAPVEETLADYARVTGEAIEELLGQRPRSPYLHALLREYPSRGGKGMRPALLIATCRAFGGTTREALGAAAAIELLHNAFLIHDDLQDASLRRRGRPTLHALHGAPLAINAGDALAALALEPLRDTTRLGGRITRRVLDEVLAMIVQTTEGQALELGWRRDNVVDLEPADYLELVAKKTCCYTTVAPLRLGALIGARGTVAPAALSRFGFYLGAAFQIRDDHLSVAGADATHGKDPLGDIREGKRTLMLLHLLRAVTPARRGWLVGFLAAPENERGDADVARVHGWMTEHGSLRFARAYGECLGAAAATAFEDAFADVPESSHLAFIRALVPYMLERTG
ncbi:polyprenyl synthetase family protein [Solirubrobacter ginsenosidimutans]|uniref:Polyprenyl synthetase family protein n=1 Tax=Solirubrobacter ginsenosidimutans TaxID=490573 RepID=A0A9X3S6Q5_9ACTN|nr:polyprenyl synthetase family protein [Solirubrobacter ginsenosidimutans]MDA0167087.1 polyprenyl synthetase family protein [Solirubrobacter ginsenosidimutans]